MSRLVSASPTQVSGQNRRPPVGSRIHGCGLTVPPNTHCRLYSPTRRPYDQRNRSVGREIKDFAAATSRARDNESSSSSSTIQTPTICSAASLLPSAATSGVYQGLPIIEKNVDFFSPCSPSRTST